MRAMATQSTNMPTDGKPTLGILLCGHSPEKVVEHHGLYDSLFVKLLGPDTFDYQTYAVVDDEFPSSCTDADAWLISRGLPRWRSSSGPCSRLRYPWSVSVSDIK